MKMLKYLLVFACVVLFLSCASMNSPQEIVWDKLDYYYELTVEEVQADIAQVIEKTESTHPYMTMRETPQSITDNYKVAKDTLQAINAGMTTLELYVHIAEYLASFSDTHTVAYTGFSDNDLVVVRPFEYKFDASIKKLVITDYPSTGANDTMEVGTAITHIGGVAVDVLIDAFSKMLGQENVAGLSRIPEYFFGHVDLLKYAGCKIENNQIEYTFETGESKFHEVLTNAEYLIKYPADNTESSTLVKTHSYKKNEDGSLYLRMIAMNDYDGSYDEFLSAVEAEVANGVKKVIIDIRSNGGGSERYPNALLQTLGFDLSDMGMYRRYSMTTKNYYNTVKTAGEKYTEPVFRSANKNDIKLKILIDVFNGSASTPLIAHTRYSGYGEIIGQASAQSPNFCGNVTTHQLNNSGIPYMLPTTYSYYMDGDKKADNIIIPDIVVPVTEDALDYVEWD